MGEIIMPTISEFTHSYRARINQDNKRIVETSVRVPDASSPWGFVVNWVDVEELVNEEIIQDDDEADVI